MILARPDSILALEWKRTLHELLRQLVTHPEVVMIEAVQSTDAKRHEFRIQVAREDMGRVIGKLGHVLDSLQTLTNAWSGRNRVPATLHLVGYEPKPPGGR